MDRDELLVDLNRMMQDYDVERLRCIYFFVLHLGKGVACDE